jgi:hypothetical protein
MEFLLPMAYFMLNPLLVPPDYGWDFLLYIATFESTIGMVLIQEYDAQIICKIPWIFHWNNYSQQI